MTPAVIQCPQSVFRPANFGPKPKPPRDGDKVQARQRVNVLVRSGRIPHPTSLPCTDCGHVWREGGRNHEYDHFHGYGAEHHGCVEVVCTRCHAVRDNARKKQTECLRGHEFTPENTIVAANGTRHCRECRRAHDRARGRDAEYWREYRRNRKTKAAEKQKEAVHG